MKFEVDIEVQTSLQAYMDFKFHVSQSRTSIQAYVDLNSHAVFTTIRSRGDGEDAPQRPQTYRRIFGMILSTVCINGGVARGPSPKKRSKR